MWVQAIRALLYVVAWAALLQGAALTALGLATGPIQSLILYLQGESCSMALFPVLALGTGVALGVVGVLVLKAARRYGARTTEPQDR